MSEIFVGNISDDVAVNAIEEEFGRFGVIVDVRFDIASAFIRYESVAQAENAIREMDGVDFCGEKLRVEFPQMPAPVAIHDDSFFDEIGNPDDSPERYIIHPESRYLLILI